MNRLPAVILTGSLLLFAAPAAASAATAALVSGTLTDAHGLPAAGSVQVLTWPRHTGTSTMSPVGGARAGADGNFTVPLADASALRASTDAVGTTDLIAVAQTASNDGIQAFSVKVGTGADGQVAVASSTSHRAVPHLTLKASMPGLFARAADHPGCTNTSQRLDGQSSFAPVGEVNSAYADTTSIFIYGSQADSSIQVGFQAAGKEGTFSGSGYVHRDNTATGVQTLKLKGRYSHRLKSEFMFGEYRLRSTCFPWTNGTAVRADRWMGGMDPASKQTHTLDVCSPGADNTQPFPGNGTLQRNANAATTYGGAINVLGASLGITSGYSQWVQIEYDFGGPVSRTHYACGNMGKDVQHAGRIFTGT